MPADVTFAVVHPDCGREAYQWHRGFAATDMHIYPRTWDTYERMADDGCIVCARDPRGDFLGLAYFNLDEGHSLRTWEIGGLMVPGSERSSGIGTTLVCVTLGQLLFEEQPQQGSDRVVAHVHAENDAPRGLFAKRLKFAHAGTLEIPGAQLPGLEADAEGFVVGDEFEMTTPDTLVALADWCEAWKGKLRDGRAADVSLRHGIDLGVWSAAFRQMANAP